MRIVSKHSDYYDGVQHQDPDKSLTFVREMVEVKAMVEDIGLRHCSVGPIGRPVADSCKNAVCFCGKIYKYVKIEVNEVVGPSRSMVFYELDEDKMAKLVLGDTRKKLPKNWKADMNSFRAWFQDGSYSYNKYKWFPEATLNVSALKKMFLEYGVPYFTVGSLNNREWASMRGWRAGPSSWKGTTIILHPRLADYEFYRVMDAFTAYQEISMFLGNELADARRKPIPELDDKTMASSKGFDKWSFRKEPDPKKGKKR